MTTTAYLLTRYRTSPGLTGDPCTHLGVWERLEDAQAYSDRHGGCGAWQTTTHDSVEYWARDTKDSEITHIIEALAYTSALRKASPGAPGLTPYQTAYLPQTAPISDTCAESREV